MFVLCLKCENKRTSLKKLSPLWCQIQTEGVATHGHRGVKSPPPPPPPEFNSWLNILWKGNKQHQLLLQCGHGELPGNPSGV